jgi:hypothetical protein
MGVLPQALEIIFEVQRKRSNEKISFPTHKTSFYFFISLDPLVLNLITFLISYSFKMI